MVLKVSTPRRAACRYTALCVRKTHPSTAFVLSPGRFRSREASPGRAATRSGGGCGGNRLRCLGRLEVAAQLLRQREEQVLLGGDHLFGRRVAPRGQEL